MSAIRTPTLVIHAQNDPWIPADPYLSFPWKDNPSLVPLMPHGGGHVGFHGEGSKTPWYDHCLGAWLAN